jgi:general secretion pathway protein G
MIVMAIILVLATLGAGRYEQSVIRAHEAALKQDLFVMRQSIQQYTLDKEAPPASLDDLVSSGYLRQIPIDPMTRDKQWNSSSDELLLSPEQTGTGITDVHSTSDQVSPFESTPYSSW